MKSTSYSYRGHIAVPYGGKATVGKQPCGLARHERGQALVEFALTLPVMLTLLVAIIVLGIVFNNYLTLTNATAGGAQQLSISRGVTTDVCLTTSQTVQSAAPNLTSGNITYSIAFGTTGTIRFD